MKAGLVFLFVLFVGQSLLAQNLIKARSGEVKYNITKPGLDSARSVISSENRVALVIGNKNYKMVPLQNSVNDANDLADLLTRKNFEVIKVLDGTRLEIREAIKKFSSKIEFSKREEALA